MDRTWILAVSFPPDHWHVVTVLGRASALQCPCDPCSRDLQALRGFSVRSGMGDRDELEANEEKTLPRVSEGERVYIKCMY